MTGASVCSRNKNLPGILSLDGRPHACLKTVHTLRSLHRYDSQLSQRDASVSPRQHFVGTEGSVVHAQRALGASGTY